MQPMGGTITFTFTSTCGHVETHGGSSVALPGTHAPSGDVSAYAVSRCACCNLTVCALCAAQIQLETHDMVTIHKS